MISHEHPTQARDLGLHESTPDLSVLEHQLQFEKVCGLDFLNAEAPVQYDQKSSRNGIETIEEAVPFGLDFEWPEQMWALRPVSYFKDDRLPRRCTVRWATEADALAAGLHLRVPISHAVEMSLDDSLRLCREENRDMLVLVDRTMREIARWYVR